jgi:hypothetical protein
VQEDFGIGCTETSTEGAAEVAEIKASREPTNGAHSGAHSQEHILDFSMSCEVLVLQIITAYGTS